MELTYCETMVIVRNSIKYVEIEIQLRELLRAVEHALHNVTMDVD